MKKATLRHLVCYWQIRAENAEREFKTLENQFAQYKIDLARSVGDCSNCHHSRSVHVVIGCPVQWCPCRVGFGRC